MLIVLNHKMNFLKEEALSYAEEMKGLFLKEDQLIICPTYTYLPFFEPIGYSLGAQDVSHYPNGAHTGNVSASQLSSLSVRYAIVGHSERRLFEKETEALIHDKMQELLKYHITPILCIGESLEEKEQGETLFRVMQEIEASLQGFTKDELEQIIIAYEPVWAIGTGLVPKEEEIDRVIKRIKEQVFHTWQIEIPVLYGGSVNQDNISSLRTISSLDGFLIGNFGLNPNNVKSILK